MHKVQIENKFIADLGVSQLGLPVIHVGSGKPRVLIINNLHGNELTGFYVLEQLIQDLPKKIFGKLTIILSANPLGLVFRSRNVPLDQADPNRGYPGLQKERGVTGNLRAELIQIAMAHDIIIDLHTFTRPCLSAAFLLDHKNKMRNALARQIAGQLNTEIFVKINFEGEEQRVASALGNYLINVGKTFVVAEYVPIRQATLENIKYYTEGLKNFLSSAGMTTNFPKDNYGGDKKIFFRQQIILDTTGLFEPVSGLGQIVKKGDVLGFLINPITLKRTTLRSPYNGTVTELADRELYLVGEKIATIGKPFVL